MESSKITVKFYADGSSRVLADQIVPVFHSWIQAHMLPDHMLIDVADYSHVPDGPGAVLVAREANYYFDRFDGRDGLSYGRKQPLDGSFTDRLGSALRAALEAATLLETDPTLAGRLKFQTDRAMIQINDRLHAPNTAETLASIAGELQSFLSQLFGGEIEIQRDLDPKRLFTIPIKAATSPGIATLLSRLGPAPGRSSAARDRQAAASAPPPAPAATSFARFDAGL